MVKRFSNSIVINENPFKTQSCSFFFSLVSFVSMYPGPDVLVVLNLSSVPACVESESIAIWTDGYSSDGQYSLRALPINRSCLLAETLGPSHMGRDREARVSDDEPANCCASVSCLIKCDNKLIPVVMFTFCA